MNCIKCNAPNLPEAKFCGNCGDELAPQTKLADNYAIKALLIIIGIEYLSTLVSLLLQKLAIPYLLGNDSISYVYNIYGWTSDIIAIAALLAFMVTVKNKQVKSALILFFVLRIVFLIGFRFINFPM